MPDRRCGILLPLNLFSFVRSKFSKVYCSTYIHVHEDFWIQQCCFSWQSKCIKCSVNGWPNRFIVGISFLSQSFFFAVIVTFKCVNCICHKDDLNRLHLILIVRELKMPLQSKTISKQKDFKESIHFKQT